MWSTRSGRSSSSGTGLPRGPAAAAAEASPDGSAVIAAALAAQEAATGAPVVPAPPAAASTAAATTAGPPPRGRAVRVFPAGVQNTLRRRGAIRRRTAPAAASAPVGLSPAALAVLAQSVAAAAAEASTAAPPVDPAGDGPAVAAAPSPPPYPSPPPPPPPPADDATAAPDGWGTAATSTGFGARPATGCGYHDAHDNGGGGGGGYNGGRGGGSGGGRGSGPSSAFSRSVVDGVFYGGPRIEGFELPPRLATPGTFPCPFRPTGDTRFSEEFGHGGRNAVEAEVLFMSCAWLQALNNSLAAWEADALDVAPSLSSSLAAHATARTHVYQV